jgi:hypothetical protein
MVVFDMLGAHSIFDDCSFSVLFGQNYEEKDDFIKINKSCKAKCRYSRAIEKILVQLNRQIPFNSIEGYFK